MATKFFMNGGVNSNWSADTNWSTTASSGPNNTTHAVAADAAILNAGSPACIVDVASAATSLVCTGYTNTLTFNANLTLTSTCTFVSGMTIAGASTLILNGTATITSGGKTISGNLQFGGSSQTFTLGDNWSVTGSLVCTGTTLITINNNGTAKTLTVAGGVTTTTNTTGSAKVVMTGGTWTGAAGYLGCPLDLQGNITVSGTAIYRTGPLTYVSGTITTTSSTLSIGAACTLNTSPVSWNTVALTAAAAITINSLLTATTLTLPDGSITFLGTAGFTVGTLSNAAVTGSRTNTFVQAATYTVTTALNLAGTAAQQYFLTSSSGTLLVPFILAAGATQAVLYVQPTRMDSSGGQTIVAILSGSVSTSRNWLAKVPVGVALIQPSLALGV